MQAIEFVGTAHDGVVDLPREYQGWNGKQVRVDLVGSYRLEATNEAAKRKTLFKAATISTVAIALAEMPPNEPVDCFSTPTSWCDLYSGDELEKTGRSTRTHRPRNNPVGQHTSPERTCQHIEPQVCLAL